jgi:excisionase family DNA binding protein
MLRFENPVRLSYTIGDTGARIAYAIWQNRGDIMVSSPFEDYLDLVEAARELGIHPQSLRRLIKQRKVPAVLFAGKYLIQRDKLEMFKSNYDPRPGRKPIRRLL